MRPGSMNGTPLPHEEPQESNPPSGVVTYYWLKTAPTTPVKLELLNPGGTVRACAASDTPVRPVDTEAINVQALLGSTSLHPRLRQPKACIAFALGGSAGRGGGGGGGRGGGGGAAAPDACTAGGAAPVQAAGGRGGRGGGRGGRGGAAGASGAAGAAPAGGGGGGGRGGAAVMPAGEYTVRLTVNGQTYNQQVTIKPDPRDERAK